MNLIVLKWDLIMMTSEVGNGVAIELSMMCVIYRTLLQ